MTRGNEKKEKKKIKTKRKSIRFICTWPLLLSMDYFKYLNRVFWMSFLHFSTYKWIYGNMEYQTNVVSIKRGIKSIH